MDKMILLLTDVENGTGCKPTIQDLEHWEREGYVYRAFETNGWITLSKVDVKLDVHCGY
jgi:hypothetical protein